MQLQLFIFILLTIVRVKDCSSLKRKICDLAELKWKEQSFEIRTDESGKRYKDCISRR
jgi:hypothetical protein